VQAPADPATTAIDFAPALLEQWRQRLRSLESCDEITSLQLISDFELPCVDFARAQSLEQALVVADGFGYPLMLKTAMPGIAHKSDKNGVRVGIETAAQLEVEYLDLQQRLGEQVLVMPMVTAGVEVSVGMKNDAQFGPMVIVACGGILIELLAERAFQLAPVNRKQAETMIGQLRLTKLLDGVRGQAAVDRVALVALIVRFSELVMALSDSIAEIDLNPVIVNQSGCAIVDALVIPASLRDSQ